MVSIFTNTNQVQDAFLELARSGLDMKRISLIGKAVGNQNDPVAYYGHHDGIQCWGDKNEFWNGLSSKIHDWIFISCPETGFLLVIGPIALWIVAVLDNVAIFSGLSALGATLYSMGLSKEKIQDYEDALGKGSYLLIVHGPAQEVIQAKKILKSVQENLVGRGP